MELSILNLLLVLAAALAGGAVATRLGYPAILGELAAGIVLGPPLLGLLEADEALAVVGEVGILLMMLYIGIHLDLGDLKRASRPGLLAAAGGFIVPAGLGYLVSIWFGATPVAAVFIGLAMGVTSLATKSRILADLEILDTRIAHVLIAGALVADMAVLIFFAAILGLAADTGQIGGPTVALDIALVVARVIGFVVVAYLVGSRVFPWVGRMVVRRFSGLDRTAVFAVLVLVGLGFAEAAELAGLHAILGAFVAGLFIDDSVLPRRMQREAESLLRAVSIGLLAPVFFVTAGFHVTLDVFQTDLAFLLTVFVVATVGKILGTALFYIPSGHGWREGVAVGSGMNGRGAVEIIVAEIALAQGLISTEIFSILVFMALSTTATVPVLLTRSVRWLRGRGELVRPSERRDVVIVGCGPVAQRLADWLQPTPVRFVDTNPDHAVRARSRGYEAVVGSAVDEDVLVAAGISSARTVVAMTANASVNVLAAQLASGTFGVPEVVVALGKSSSSGGITDLLSGSGAKRQFGDIVDLTAWDVALEDGEATEVDLTGEEIGGDATVLPLVVVRGGTSIPFHASMQLEKGDVVRGLRRRSAGDVTDGPTLRVAAES